MADLARVKRNINRMISMDAPEAEIDAYIASEGTSVDEVRAFKMPATDAPTGEPSPRLATPVLAPSALTTSSLAGGNSLMFGFGDEIGSALFAPVEMAAGALNGEDSGKSLSQRIMDGYSRGLRKREDLMAYAEGQHPMAATVGTIAGATRNAAALTKGGLSFATNAAQRGAGLARVAGASAVDGAIVGGLTGAGNGSGLEGRLTGAAGGAVGGAALGLAAPVVVAGASSLAKPLIAPVAARLRPQEYANSAIGTAMRRAGTTPDEIADELAAAQRTGLDSYTVADAMGNSGQRMLSTVTRTPNDARQGVVEALGNRQMDQGRRVANILSDAAGTPQTAAQYQETLRRLRQVEAGTNYGPVQVDPTPIDVSPAVAVANRSISPVADTVANARGAVPTDLAARSGAEAGERAIADPIREAVRTARSYLASDTLTVTNVEKAFRAKTNIDQMIATATEKGQGGIVAELMPIQQALDDALARTSPNYAQARDAYRVATGRVDAVDTGRGMAAGRTRIDDNLEQFGALPDEASRQAARVGYFDPKIAKAESQAGSMTNSARPFISESARREIPALAAPMSGDDVMPRLAREQRMFETASVATGGSKTADNLADMEDMANFDPAMISRLLRGDFLGAGMAALTKAMNEAKGLPPRVVERIAEGLMETNPATARQLLSIANTKAVSNEGRKRAAVTVLRSAAIGVNER